MTVVSYLYQKLRLLKLPVVGILLTLLWLSVSLFVVVVDINNQSRDLFRLYQVNSVNHNQVLAISKASLNLSPTTSKEITDQQISRIQAVKYSIVSSNQVTQFNKLKPRLELDKDRLVRVLDNNTAKANLQICQGDKINQINQNLLEISKIDIKPYSKTIITEIENSFGQIKSNLDKAIDSNNQLIRCFANSDSIFVSQANYYSLIRFSKYLSGVNQIYSRIIETLKAENRAGLDEGLVLIKDIDINNFVTLKPGFFIDLEKNKNQILDKNITILMTRENQITEFLSFIKSNNTLNF